MGEKGGDASEEQKQAVRSVCVAHSDRKCRDKRMNSGEKEAFFLFLSHHHRKGPFAVADFASFIRRAGSQAFILVSAALPCRAAGLAAV